MRRIVMAWLPLVCLSACGGGSGGDGIPLADLGTRAQEEICGLEVRCGVFPDHATCAASVRSDLGQLMASVNAGKTKYDGVAAAACLDAVTSGSCDPGDASPSPQSCKDAFQGTVATGGPCFVDEECVSLSCDQLSCNQLDQCCAGKCKAGALPIGGDCSAADSACVDEAFCQQAAGGGGTCTARLAAGQPCTGFLDCKQGLLCQRTGAGPGTCVNLPIEGEACNPGLPCGQTKDICDSSTNRCVPRTPLGNACSAAVECVLYASCDPASATCVSKGGVGTPCVDGSECYVSLECINAKCALPVPKPVCQ